VFFSVVKAQSPRNGTIEPQLGTFYPILQYHERIAKEPNHTSRAYLTISNQGKQTYNEMSCVQYTDYINPSQLAS